MSRTYSRETCVEQCVITRVASEAHADLMSDTKTTEKKLVTPYYVTVPLFRHSQNTNLVTTFAVGGYSLIWAI